MAHYIIKTRPNCEWCDKAKALLTEIGETYTEQKHETDAEIAAFRHAGFKTFPQIFRDGVLVGGYSELVGHLLSEEAA